MNKEFLKKLGIEDDAIGKIIAEYEKETETHNQTAETLKTKDTEISSLKEQLKTANKQIADFKNMDIESIKKSADDYKTKFEESEKNAKAEIEKLKFDFALDGALVSAKARNSKAVKALLDMENLKFADGQITGLKEQIEKVKKENDFLFEKENEPPKPSFARGSGFGDDKNIDESAVRAIMGLPPIENK